MKLRTLAALALATCAVSFAAPASAASKMNNLRFETGGSIAGTPFLQGNFGGDIRVGYDLAGGFTPLVGLSFRNMSHDIDDVGSEGQTLFVLNVEGRYYFRPHKKGISPFGFAGVDFNNFSIGHEDKDGKAVNEAADAADGDSASFWGLNAGFGLEYLASKSFGVGGKWGLNMTFNNTSVQEKDGAKAGQDASHTTWGTASSFYLTWRF
ncbi:MAG TPA: outer membrane beta-barrel protein [Vulgatibacter sp.]|nr:outer membrane beta-barrel protein [Vulgatibacter sp.]